MDLNRLSDEELLAKIEYNNTVMQNIINVNPSIVESHDKSKLDNVFSKNLGYYLEALNRKLKIPDMSFVMAVATILGYTAEELKIEKTNKLTKKRKVL